MSEGGVRGERSAEDQRRRRASRQETHMGDGGSCTGSCRKWWRSFDRRDVQIVASEAGGRGEQGLLRLPYRRVCDAGSGCGERRRRRTIFGMLLVDLSADFDL